MSYLDKRIDDYITADSSFSLECDELDMYDFPDEDIVPEGEYASMIMGVCDYKDKYNNRYFDICYKIFSGITYTLWNDKAIDKISYSYIRQRYLRGSDEERRLRSAMYNMCKRKSITSDDLQGIIELIEIVYDKSGNGFIKKRSSTTINSLWFVDDESDEFYWSAGYTFS